jgi:hypothetical protein
VTEPNRRVLLLAAGGRDRASSRLRVHGWADRLSARGIACTTLVYYDPAWMRGRARYPRIRAALRAPGLWRRVLESAVGADAALLQEVVPPRRVVAKLRATVGRLVFDLSDPIHSADAPGLSGVHRLLHARILRPRLEFLVRTADVTLVENDRVGRWVAEHGGRVQVVRGPVDTAAYRPRPAGRRPDGSPAVLGWTGSDATVAYLEALRPTLEELYRARRDFQLVAFGISAPLTGWRMPVRAEPWNASVEPSLVADFDIGLNPVPVSAWGRLRGGAKLMVYMAAGVPTVSADSGIADQVIEPGRTGFIASSPEQWHTALAALLDDPDLRARMGREAREQAVRRYSYDAYDPVLRGILLGAAGAG